MNGEIEQLKVLFTNKIFMMNLLETTEEAGRMVSTNLTKFF